MLTETVLPAPRVHEPIPCGGGCKNNDETPKMVEPSQATLDQTVKPEPAIEWRCICGWAKTLPLRLLTG